MPRVVGKPDGLTCSGFFGPPIRARRSSLAFLAVIADDGLGCLHGRRGRRLPNPHVLIRPFVRREAVLSSRIEGTQATLLEEAPRTAELPKRTEHTFRVDASYDRSRGVTGIGLVLHRSIRSKRDGAVIATFGEAYRDVPAGLIEKFAVFRALEIAKEWGFSEVRIRSDYNWMRTRLQHDHRAGSPSEGRDILHDLVLQAAREFDRVRFAWVPRRRNHQAHRLARRAAQELSPRSRPDVPWQA
jgi:ribonuclease HI